MLRVLKEFVLFLREERKWWLVPMLVVMALVGIFVVVAHVAPGMAPFLYPLG